MKKYLCSAALVLASCAPAQSYAGTVSQCESVRDAYLSVLNSGTLTSGSKQVYIVYSAKMISAMYPEVSYRGAMYVAYAAHTNGSWGWEKEPYKIFDECMKDGKEFNAKYFKGDVK